MALSTQKHNVVIEFVNDVVNVGLAGDLEPRFSFEVSFSVDDRHKSEWSESELFQHYRLTATNIFRRVFYEYLHVKSSTVRVLLIEKLLWPQSLRDALISSLLVDYQVAAVSFQSDTSASIIGSDTAHGIIVYIDDEETRVTAFSHHRPLLHTMKSKQFN